MHVNKKGRWLSAVAMAAVLAPGVMPVQAQYRQNHRDFYNGAYQGGRGGYYGHGHDYNGGYYRDDRYHGHGIGTGTGAAIGGAGGAALGALFGGGLKGALIGGAAGAGIGAIAGHAHQENMKRNYYRYR